MEREWRVTLTWQKDGNKATTFEDVIATSPLKAIAAAQEGWQPEPGWEMMGLEVQLLKVGGR